MKAQDPKISHDEVRARFHYDPIEGKLYYRSSPSNRPMLIGSEAGYIRQTNGGEYRVVKIDGRHVYTHRLIWFYIFGEWPKGQIDHHNGNKLDNRITNFRVSTQSQNKSNCKKPRSNTSGYKGVVKYGLRWKAQITHQQKVIYLGLYDTREAAHAAYVAAANELQGRFANPG
jgi:hypothetical protein